MGNRNPYQIVYCHATEEVMSTWVVKGGRVYRVGPVKIQGTSSPYRNIIKNSVSKFFYVLWHGDGVSSWDRISDSRVCLGKETL